MKGDSSDSLYVLLEIVNSLTICFVLTELFRFAKSKSLLIQLATQYGIPWLVVNFLISYLSVIRAVLSTSLYYVYVIFSPFVLITKWLGSTIVIIFLIIGIYSIYRKFASKSDYSSNYQNDFRIASVCVILVLLKVRQT